MTSPSVAVVGRQNVGKSTLVNRLFGRREAIAHPMPGVTRDRVELETTWRGRPFRLVDTGGYAGRATGIDALVSAQADRAAELADVIVLVTDGRTGPVEEDATLARKLRRAEAPVVLVVNKIDTADEEVSAAAFHGLGLGEPVAVSALHGLGVGELLDRLVALLPDAPRARSRRPRSRGSPSSAGRTWASPRCSTVWWGRSARSCSRRPAPPATPSTPSSDGRTSWSDSSIRRGSAEGRR